ncbi:MAG TPA: hypothetical protein VNH11_13095 [Pirellulales bacterium]|nr:hypothetical protein [Pirellulales bacterium]
MRPSSPRAANSATKSDATPNTRPGQRKSPKPGTVLDSTPKAGVLSPNAIASDNVTSAAAPHSHRDACARDKP